MKCDICGIRSVSGVISMVSGGRSVTRRICLQCMSRLRRPSAYTVEMTLLATAQCEHENAQCPRCGMKFQEVQRTGKVGCAACYAAFAPALNPILEKINAVAEGAPAMQTTLPPDDPAQRLHALREEMFQAVQQEEYERAAALRDQIRSLQRAQASQEGTP